MRNSLRGIPVIKRSAKGLILFLAGGVLGAILVACSTGGSASTAKTATQTVHAQVSSSNVPVPQVDKLAEQTVEKIGAAIVEVKNVGVGLGSGVILTKSGYIVTNNHVVANGSQYTVSLANGSTLPAKVIGTDPVDDLAVVKVVASHPLPVAPFGDSSQLLVGETVLAIGNPLGITRTVTEGIISALDRSVVEGQSGGSIPDAVQTSAAINPGNSGGALVNLGAQVVGIPTLTAVDPQFNTPAPGIGFAIPSNTVKRIANQIIKYGKVIHSGRAALGIFATSVTPALAAQYGLPISHGVLVAQVQPGGAQKAGMQQGDVIIKVGSHAIATESDLFDALSGKRPGQKVTVSVITRSGAARTFQVTLQELKVNAHR